MKFTGVPVHMRLNRITTKMQMELHPARLAMFGVRTCPKRSRQKANDVIPTLETLCRFCPPVSMYVCDQDDSSKLKRLLEYLLATRERGITLRIGEWQVAHEVMRAVRQIWQAAYRDQDQHGDRTRRRLEPGQSGDPCDFDEMQGIVFGAPVTSTSCTSGSRNGWTARKSSSST
jgi:hypothetical protein